MDTTKIVKWLLIAYACTLTYNVITWAMSYAEKSQLDGTNIAVVIAAVNAPIIALNGYLANKL